MSHFFQVVHLVDETGHRLQHAHNLILLRLTLNCHQELLFRYRSQEATFRLDDEEDDLDVAINVDFNLSCVSLKEAVCWIVFKVDKSLSVSLDHVTELVKQVVDVEAFTDLTIKRVCLQAILNSVQSRIRWQCQLFCHKFVVKRLHTLQDDLEVSKRLANFLVDLLINFAFDDTQE